MVLIIAGPILIMRIEAKYASSDERPVLEALQVPGWEYGPDAGDRYVQPIMFEPDAKLTGSYRAGPSTVYAYIYAYTSTENKKEVITHTNTMYDPERWIKVQQGTWEYAINELGTLTVNEIVVKQHEHSRLIQYVYSINGKILHSPWKVKLHESLVKARYLSMDSRLLVFSTTIRADLGVARKTMEPVIKAYLDLMHEQ